MKSQNLYEKAGVSTSRESTSISDMSHDGIPLFSERKGASLRLFAYWKKHKILSIVLALLIIGLIGFTLLATTSGGSTQTEDEGDLSGIFEFTGSKPSNVTYYDKIKAHQKTQNFLWEKRINGSNPMLVSSMKNHEIASEDIIPNLCVKVIPQSKKHFNLQIRDCDKTRFEIPYEFPFPFANSTSTPSLEECEFDFSVSSSDPFEIQVRRKDTQEGIWNFSLSAYTNRYIEFNLSLASKEVYGLGERTSPLQYRPGTYSLFTLDRGGAIDYGVSGGNGQGHQPAYLSREQSGKYHMVYLRNSNFQEFTIFEENLMLWQTTGGIIDLNVFLGDENPETVVKDFHLYCGGWAMPGFWHMGHQINRWTNYTNVSELAEVLEGFDSARIPLDAVWSDPSYFEDNTNFNFDEERFPAEEMRNLLTQNDKRWLAVAKPYLSKGSPVDEFETTDKTKSAFLTIDDKKLCPAEDFGTNVYIIDYSSEVAEELWPHLLASLDKKVHYSGLWLEASGIFSISANLLQRFKNKYKKYDDMPFKPGGGISFYEHYMVAPDCIHANGIEEYDFRPFSVLKQAEMTYAYFKAHQKTPLPFIMTKANTVGSGKFAYHLLPEVFSSWEALRASMGALLTYPILGYAMTGVDIGGFFSQFPTSSELITRWYQLSVFYPYFRNSHMPSNNLKSQSHPQAPRKALIDSIYLRYSLLKWFYAQFIVKQPTREEAAQYNINSKGIGTIVRPLFFKFFDHQDLPPYGSAVYDEQFLVGDAIMVTPALRPVVTELYPFFPKGHYVDLRDHSAINLAVGAHIPIRAKLDEPAPYFLISGSFLYLNHFETNSDSAASSNNKKYIKTTKDLDNEFDLEIAFDSDLKSSSQLLNVKNYEVEEIYNSCILKNCVVNATFHIQNFSSTNLSNHGFQMQLSLGNASVSPVDWKAEVLFRKVYLHNTPLSFDSISKIRLDNQSSGNNLSDSILQRYADLAFKKANDSILITFNPPISISDLSRAQVLLLKK